MEKYKQGKVRSVKFRVSEDEYEKILLASHIRNMRSLSDYCRLCIRNPQIFDDEYQRQQLKDVIFQLRKMGNNINQIARNINAGLFEGDVGQLVTKLETIRSVLQRIETAVLKLEEREEISSDASIITEEDKGEEGS